LPINSDKFDHMIKRL